MRVMRVWIRAEEFEIFPVPDSWHQGNAQQMCQTKHGRTLRLRVAMNGLRPDRGIFLSKHIQNVRSLPDSTGNKVTEERDVRIRDMIIADSPITTIADVIFGQQVLLVHLPLGAVGGSAFAGAPVFGKLEAVVSRNDCADGLIQLFFRDMVLIDPGEVTAIDSTQ